MDNQTLKKLLYNQLKQLGWRMVTVVILIMTAVVTVWVYASFVEPSVGPNSSDQDFVQNILGNDDANNDFDSSSAISNKDGSIVERLEYVQGQGSTTPTCGNGILEAGENCDDGGISWTAGACAGDCTRQNYWNNPSIAEAQLFETNINYWCQLHKFNSVNNISSSLVSSYTTSSQGGGAGAGSICGSTCSCSFTYYTYWILRTTLSGFKNLLNSWESASAQTSTLLSQSVVYSYPVCLYTSTGVWTMSYETLYSMKVSGLWCAD